MKKDNILKIIFIALCVLAIASCIVLIAETGSFGGKKTESIELNKAEVYAFFQRMQNNISDYKYSYTNCNFTDLSDYFSLIFSVLINLKPEEYEITEYLGNINNNAIYCEEYGRPRIYFTEDNGYMVFQLEEKDFYDKDIYIKTRNEELMELYSEAKSKMYNRSDPKENYTFDPSEIAGLSFRSLSEEEQALVNKANTVYHDLTVGGYFDTDSKGLADEYILGHSGYVRCYDYLHTISDLYPYAREVFTKEKADALFADQREKKYPAHVEYDGQLYSLSFTGGDRVNYWERSRTIADVSDTYKIILLERDDLDWFISSPGFHSDSELEKIPYLKNYYLEKMVLEDGVWKFSQLDWQ